MTVQRVDTSLSILTSKGWAAPRAIDTQAAAVLVHCLPPRALAEHAEHAARRLGIGAPATLLPVLDRLLEAGLLREVPALSGDSPSARTGSFSIPIETVAIVTADRPRELNRCLDSYVGHLLEHGRRVRLVVVDGSRDPDNSRAIEHAVAARRTTPGVHVEYLGAAVRAAVKADAIEHGFEPAAIDWLLPTPSPIRAAGGVRNLMLLATTGSRVLTVDDDTVCRPWRHATFQAGVSFIGHVDSRETEVFDSRSAAIDDVPPSDIDLLAAHEQLLGCSLQHLADSPDADYARVCPHLMAGLDARESRGRVRATWAGIAGDSASPCPYPMVFSLGPTRSRLASSEMAFATALGSREVRRCVPRACVIDEPWLMTYCAGLDNATLLPPFSAVGSNEDGVFGTTLRVCDGDAFVGQIPYGIVHDSARPSAYDHGEIVSASRIRLADIVQWLIAPWGRAAVGTSSDRRMRSLGAHLVACGELDPRDFHALLLERVVEAKCEKLRACERLLASGFEYPPYWRAAMRRYQQAILTSLGSPTVCAPTEWASTGDQRDADLFVQEHLRHFGRALMVWPDLWARQGGRS